MRILIFHGYLLRGTGSNIYNTELARVYQQEKDKGNYNRATLAVARKMVAYLLAVDRRKTGFVSPPAEKVAPAEKVG